jgi:hypothetical protein
LSHESILTEATVAKVVDRVNDPRNAAKVVDRVNDPRNAAKVVDRVNDPRNAGSLTRSTTMEPSLIGLQSRGVARAVKQGDNPSVSMLHPDGFSLKKP